MLCFLKGSALIHDHVKNACKYVKPFTPNKEEEKEEEEQEEEEEAEEEEERRENTTEKGEVCECVRMRLSANEAKKEKKRKENRE